MFVYGDVFWLVRSGRFPVYAVISIVVLFGDSNLGQFGDRFSIYMYVSFLPKVPNVIKMLSRMSTAKLTGTSLPMTYNKSRSNFKRKLT